MEVVTIPNKVLRQRAVAVRREDIPSYAKLVKEMHAAMNRHDGIGLAAPQVGVSKRIIMVNVKDGPLVLFNPKLTRRSFKKVTAEEGCLSVPGVFGLVKRHQSLTVSGFAPDGTAIQLRAEGMLARVLQHEVDHIDGILFIDRANKLTKGTPPHEPYAV